MNVRNMSITNNKSDFGVPTNKETSSFIIVAVYENVYVNFSLDLRGTVKIRI